MDTELALYFPAWFGMNDTNFLDKMIRMVELRIFLNEDSDNSNLLDEVKELDEFFLDNSKPKAFAGASSELIQRDNYLEGLYSAMEESNINVNGMTVYEFHARLQHFDKKAKELKNGH